MKIVPERVSAFKFTTISAVSAQLVESNIPSHRHFSMIASAMELGPRKARMLTKAIIKCDDSFESVNRLLTDVRRAGVAGTRKEVTRALREARKGPALITGISLMATADASIFMRDYLESGGTLRSVVRWIDNISAIYKVEKEKGNIDPAFDGLWGDLWDGVVSLGSGIGAAIRTVVDAVIEAGHSFGEFVGELVVLSQRRLNAIVEALIDAGAGLEEIIDGALTLTGGILDAAHAGLVKVFKAVLAVGGLVEDALTYLVSKGARFIRAGVELLATLGTSIREILEAAIGLADAAIEAVVGALFEMGRSVFYVLNWMADRAFGKLVLAFRKLREIGRSLGDLVAWCGRQADRLVRRSVELLIRAGYSVGEVMHTLLTDPRGLMRDVFRALHDIAGNAYGLFETAQIIGAAAVARVIRALDDIGMDVAEIFGPLGQLGFRAFRKVAKLYFITNYKVFEVILWSANQGARIFGWAMRSLDDILDHFIDIFTEISVIGGPIVEAAAGWIAERARESMDWLKFKLVIPALALGKVALLVVLAKLHIGALVTILVALKDLAGVNVTDFKEWPAGFEEFRDRYSARISTLPAVSENHGYVVFSDAHRESNEDIQAGIGHFHRNRDLFLRVMEQFAEEEAWTIIELGDGEEFWQNADVGSQSGGKIDDIVATHPDVYSLFSEEFYKRRSPRRYVKIRGNHDDIWRDMSDRRKLARHGFPGIDVFDFAIGERDGQAILFVHGQQFDDYNCDANSFLGKFVSNFVAEPLDVLNETITEILGENFRIEGLGVSPYYERREWSDIMESEVREARLVDGLGWDERDVTGQMRAYDCSLVMGHTHLPKILRDRSDGGRWLANVGTCGWWEGCVWTLEIAADDVRLKAWTEEALPEPLHVFPLSASGFFS